MKVKRKLYAHHLKWSCIKTGPGLYFGPDLPLNWSRLASIMVRKPDSKMVLSAECKYVQNYINHASDGVKLSVYFHRLTTSHFHNVFGRACMCLCV